MEEIEVVVVKRFGDEQSTLLDQFERLSFEVQLNQAILARSLSEPGVEAGRNHRVQHPLTLRDHIAEPEPEPAEVKTMKGSGKRGSSGSSGFNRFLKKLLKPILGTRRKATPVHQAKQEALAPNLSSKAFSRSVRF